MDYAKLSELFIKKQENFYDRNLSEMSKHLVKQFAEYIQKQETREATKISTTVLPENKPLLGPTKIKDKLEVALITEDVGHLTGGRYYCWFIACALQELGYDVTVYTNQKPVFGDEFKKYKQPKVSVIATRARDLENIDIRADIYIGSPISGNIAASRLGKKYIKPSYALIFDPFPMMAKYLGSQKYMGWEPLIGAMRSSNTNVINLCNTTTPYCTTWLNKRLDQIHPIYPCINSREFDRETEVEHGDYVVFVSRLVKHKNFDHVLKACKHLGIPLKVIASVDGVNAWKMIRDLDMEKQVELHMKVSDKKKFEIIRGARVLVNASKFEGFGMWYIEALACGVPTVCYDYPTIREIQEYAKATNVYYADWDNPVSFEKQLDKAYREQKYSRPSTLFDFTTMLARVNEVFRTEPKIGVVTIALNEEQFIRASLKSVIRHPNVVKVAVVEGAVNLYPRATKNGLSTDNTSEEVYIAMSELAGDKIIYEKYGWAVDKSELRNRALVLLGTDITHVLVVDADEVYKQEDLDNLVQAMRDNPMTGVFLFPFYHFWKQKNLIASGGQWESQMFRCFRYGDKSLKWKLHNAPVVNNRGQFINVAEGQMNLDNVHVYHLSYLKDGDSIRDKLKYYKLRDGHILNVQDTWTDWKPGMITQPTHGGGGTTAFHGEYPDEIKELIKNKVIK